MFEVAALLSRNKGVGCGSILLFVVLNRVIRNGN